MLEAVGGDAGAEWREHAMHALQRLPQVQLGGVQPYRPLVLPVRHLRKILVVTRDAEIEIDFVVVRRKIGVREGPLLSISIVALGFEIVIGEAKRKASPQIRLAPDDASARPGVTGAGVGMLFFLDEQVFAVV